MKCPMCDGTGKSEIGVGAFTIHGADCDRCNGKGVVEPMTNEEWFCQLPTYKKAILMANCYDAFNLDQYACNKHVVIEEWLKEKHE